MMMWMGKIGLAVILTTMYRPAFGQSDICATPSNFVASATVEGQPCSNFVTLLNNRASGDCQTDLGSGSTLHQSLWFLATQCCSDSEPNTICGDYETVCQVNANFNPLTTLNGGSSTCAASSVSTIVPLLTGSSCDLVAGGGGSVTLGQTVLQLAHQCCTGGAAAANDVCGAAPTAGSMCANSGDFQSGVDSGFGNCDSLQLGFLVINLYGDSAQCDVVSPGGSNVPNGALFAAGAERCCNGGAIASVCSANRVSPCGTPSDFTPQENIIIGSSDSEACSLATLYLYGATPATCDQTPSFAGPDSPSVRAFISLAGRDCCGTGEPNFLCGTPSPTPMPPPRVGTATACGGDFEVHRVDQPGGVQCLGTPSESGSIVEPCDAFTGDTGETMHLFLISNGGACVNFATEVECLTAAAAVQSIVAGADVTMLAPNSPDAQCFLSTGTCAAYQFPFGIALKLEPACGCTGTTGKSAKGGCASSGKSAKSGKTSKAGKSKKAKAKAKTKTKSNMGMSKGKKSTSGVMVGGTASATSGTVIAVALVAVVAVAAALVALRRRFPTRLQPVERSEPETTVINPLFDGADECTVGNV
eukprot:m.355085 g.355085  ORF g.355085 m.355085 type:complete len:588 (+) comp28007_c3_seq1:285-2048(+)